MSERRLLVDRFHEAFNARRFEDLGELFDEDVLMVIEGTTLRGRTAALDYLAGVVRQIPGMRVELEGVVADSGDTIVCLTRSMNTSPADAEDAADGVGPAFTTSYLVVRRIAAGRIVEYRHYLHSASGDEGSGGTPARLSSIHRLVSEQAALRRVATLVARGAAQAEVFDAVVSETAKLFGQETWLVRYGADDSATITAQHGGDRARELTGVTLLQGVEWAGRLARPTRVDDCAGATGFGSQLAQQLGVVACAAAPLSVQRTPWGALVLVSRGPRLAVGIEDRLAQFADLAATAIANAQSRAELQSLADEQAALRRVAELVARGAPTQQVFDRVTADAAQVLDGSATVLMRYEPSGAEAQIVAQWPSPNMEARWPAGIVPNGTRIPVVGDIGIARVWRTGRPAQIDDFRGVAGAEVIPHLVDGAAAALAPIVVEGRLWGVLITGSPTAPLPAGAGRRLVRFCELVAVAIANAETRAELTASRARIVASADEARRRLARDVHDGAQQRLVHTLIALKQARGELQGADPAVARLLDESLAQAESANAQLRELTNGILPAALAHGGLRAGLEPLLRHAPLPVEAEVLRERLPEPVETTGYFVIAEAVTNVIKHAGASRAHVRALRTEDRLEIEVSDDGRGGADPAAGSGLIGLIDRVDAAGGSMSISSPPGGGTTLTVTLPIEASGLHARHDQSPGQADHRRASSYPYPAGRTTVPGSADDPLGPAGRR